MQPDYSRQQLLKEIGSAGQARLGAARVLIVGLGGLGSPVLQYLAGAGVGTLGIVDADTLEASNLHRQPIYALEDVAKPKTALARLAIARINPSIHIETHALRFSAANASNLVARYDLVVDCSDNFATKFLINDAAVLAHKPAVFASVYQYEGQLQVYKPESAHACLRCLWPAATADGVVGNCAEAGVLGPVPGIFGSLQALLTIKILLGLPGQLAGELLLFDFMNVSTLTLEAPRRSACTAPACSLIHGIAPDEPEVELVLGSLAMARTLGLAIVDIRTCEEVAARPSGTSHIPMDRLLQDPGLLPAGQAVLLVCETGKRSSRLARELLRRGIAVRSLAGGLQRMQG